MKRSTAIVALAALALVGCGRSGDRAQAIEVVERFTGAVAAGRGEAACEQLSDAAVDELESQGEQPCADAVRELRVGDAPVVRAHVYVTNAAVQLADGETFFLGREGDVWRLSAVACRAEDGAPRERPLSCEVEA